MLYLEQLRRNARLSQSKLAQKADLHPSTVCSIINGNLNPYPSQLQKLADALEYEGNPIGLLKEVKG